MHSAFRVGIIVLSLSAVPLSAEAGTLEGAGTITQAIVTACRVDVFCAASAYGNGPTAAPTANTKRGRLSALSSTGLGFGAIPGPLSRGRGQATP